MRQRSNLMIVLGVAFFLIGGAIVYLILSGDDTDGGTASGTAQVTVFVATSDIPANTPGATAIEDGLLRTDQVTAGAEPVGAITSAAQLDNQIFAVNVGEGEVITGAQLAVRSLSNITVPDGYDGVAVTMSYTNGGAGYVAPGDRVNVYGVFGGTDDVSAGLATVDGQPGTKIPRTELLLTNVLVLDVSSQAETSAGATSAAVSGNSPTASRTSTEAPLTYLLAMTPTDIERIVLVTSFADLYVSLTADDAPDVGDTPGADGSRVLAPVSSASSDRRG